MVTKKVRSAILFTVLLMVFGALAPLKVNAAPKLNETSVVVMKKKTSTVKITGTKKKAIWSSNNKKIASVSKSGKIKAGKAGTTTITAKIGKKKYYCKVTVFTNEKTLLEEANNWVVDDLWNKAFIEIYSYTSTGKSIDGKKLNINKVIKNLKTSMKKLSVYNTGTLQLDSKKYKKDKTTWKSMKKEIDKLYKIVKKSKPGKADPNYIFPCKKFDRLMNKFNKLIE